MARFEVTARDGRKYEIDAASPEAAQSAWQSFIGPQEPQSGVVEDYAKAIGSGLVEGGEALAGFAGDALDLARGAGTWIGNKLREAEGRPPVEQAPDPLGISDVIPNTREVAEFQRGITGFEPYEPERAGARYAKTAASFVPAAATFGAGGGAKGAMYAAGKFGVVPGLTSEAGGDVASLAYGEEARPYGKVAGALAGPVVAAGAKRAITPFPASPTQNKAVAALGKEGVTSLSAGQKSGSRGLQMFESQQAPAKMAQMADDVGEQFTSAALRKAGVSGKDILPETINAGFEGLGRKFDYFTSNYSVQWDNSLTRSLRSAVGKYQSKVSPPNRAPIVTDYAREAVETAAQNGGVIPGAAYQSLRSRISSDARSMSDPDTGTALRELLSSIDDAMERAIARSNPSDVGKYKLLRQQYKNMLVLDRAASMAGAESAAGVLNPARLRAASRQVEGYKGRSRGYSDFDEMIRAGEIALKRMPDSGTASRLATYGVPTMGGITGGLAGYEASGDPWGALVGGLLGAGARNAATAALLSKPGMGYLGNQVFSKTVTPQTAQLATALNATLPVRSPQPTPPIPALVP